jgi:hypothetical protein
MQYRVTWGGKGYPCSPTLLSTSKKCRTRSTSFEDEPERGSPPRPVKQGRRHHIGGFADSNEPERSCEDLSLRECLQKEFGRQKIALHSMNHHMR